MICLSPQPETTDVLRDDHKSSELVQHQIVWPRSAKLFTCILLLGVSVRTWSNQYCRPLDVRQPEKRLWEIMMEETAQLVFYLYLSFLAFIARIKLSPKASTHLTLLLLIAFGVSAYENLVPLGTYTANSKDGAGGRLAWSRLALLFIAGVVIPIVSPRKHRPVDPLHPSPATPEQTASILSLALFSFLDSVVIKASRMPSLSYDELPVLADSDRADHLAARSFPSLDPSARVGKPQRHIFLGLVWVYRRQLGFIAAMLVLRSVLQMASPVAINRILNYLESPGDGEELTIRPWVWVLALLVGPVTSSIIWEAFSIVLSRLVVWNECILTQLVFERALKMRFADEASNEGRGAEGRGPAGPRGDLPNHTRNSDSNSNLTGKLINLISTDLMNVTGAREFMLPLICAPVEITLSVWFLYYILGWSAFVGVLTLVLISPIPVTLSTLIHGWQVEQLKRTDARVQIVTEALNVNRMIKMFGWEKKVESQVGAKRDEELHFMQKKRLSELAIDDLKFLLPQLVALTSFATYTLVMKQDLTASRIFSSIAAFDLITAQLHRVFGAIPAVVAGKVSLDRIDAVLKQTELLDTFTESERSSAVDVTTPLADLTIIGFRDATFQWTARCGSGTASGGTSPSKRNFRLVIEGDLWFKRGKINLIVGPTGSGEMHFSKNTVASFLNLPRDGGVAFCAQEPWIQNASVKENILFGSPYDERRYRKVLYQCALEHDLASFDAGDATEVGDKGLTLSGGQKARVALARTVYSRAEIVLLDDILSALDVHTSSWIVGNCLCGDLMSGRTVLLVTHNVAMTNAIAERIVAVGSNGRVTVPRDMFKALREDPALRANIDRTQDTVTKEQEVLDSSLETAVIEKIPFGQFVAEEEVVIGKMGWRTYVYYLNSWGGISFWVPFVVFIIIAEMTRVMQAWFLGYWASQYDDHTAAEVDAAWYLCGYGLLGVLLLACWNVSIVMQVLGTIRSSRILHQKLLQTILGTTLRWIDSTPMGRITSRCTSDMQVIDESLPLMVFDVSDATISMFLKFASVAFYNPIFIIPGVVAGVLSGLIGSVYLSAQLPIKRAMSNTKSPILSYFSAAMAGATTIRAFGKEETFKAESQKRMDCYSRPAITFYNLNSIERIKGYTEIDQEPQSKPFGEPPAYWPSSGSLRVEGLSARYSPDGPKVLHNVNFNIKHGERVGVVGRTGAGKSSLSLAILRLIPTSGKMYYDDVDTNLINLDALRNSISIIPQQPELMSGTLRQNLDPFGEYDDSTLNSCLRSAGFFSIQDDGESGSSIWLDANVTSGGTNFSVGQRQIIALARAMVRRSKVYILDEATASVDYKTDAAIQRAIASEFTDMTLIIVAHRLQTVMAVDKILVLDAGQVVEFDSPSALMEKGGTFKAMVDESGDREALYKLANLPNRGRPQHLKEALLSDWTMMHQPITPKELTIKQASSNQTRISRESIWSLWGCGLSREQFLERYDRLDNWDLTIGNRMTTWVLVPRNDAETDAILARCETKVAVLNPLTERVDLSIGYTIGYVYVPDHLLGLGYGKHMMRLLHHVLAPPHGLPAFPTREWGSPPVQRFGDATVSVLYSGVGDYYTTCGPTLDKSGWAAAAKRKSTWTIGGHGPSHISSISHGPDVRLLNAEEIKTVLTQDDALLIKELSNASSRSSNRRFVFVPSPDEFLVGRYQIAPSKRPDYASI
ncbi:hypothetical protein FRB96_003344 [Tulasnella sp. 330]|nr:hypothetical protein FRB96_003344 [Tulasnella sp. 330]